MRNCFICVIFLMALSVSSFAEPMRTLPHRDGRNAPRMVFNPKDSLPADLLGEQRARAWLAENRDVFELGDILNDLRLTRTRQSLVASHFHFQQYLNNIPVDRAEIIVSIGLRDGRVRKVFNNLYPVQQPVAPSFKNLGKEVALDAAWNHLRVHGDLFRTPEGELFYAPEKNRFRLIYKTRINVAAPSGSWEHRIDAETGEVLEYRSLYIKRKKDHEELDFAEYKGPVRSRQLATEALAAKKVHEEEPPPSSLTVNGTGVVFDPNPVITLMNDSLVDGSPDALFDPAYFTNTLLDITENAGVYTLDGPWVRIRALSVSESAPNTPPSTTIDGNWTAKRGNNAFNDAMVYYHIDKNQRYIQSLGFTGPSGIQELSIRADTDAANGADQSFFSSGDNALLFGHGCVDDAEDSDVILHEYGHALQWDINNNWSDGDTGGMGEGFGDYWAASYRYKTPNGPLFHPEWVFSWDAHNTCWAGRRLNRTTYRYTPGRVYDAHASTSGVLSDELWSTPLFTSLLALLQMGRAHEEMDRIVLESHFGLGSGIIMPEMAEATIAAAKSLHPSGPHAEVYRRNFRLHHILALPKPDISLPAAAGTLVHISWGTNTLPNDAFIDLEYTGVCVPGFMDDMENGANGWTVSHTVGSLDWAQVAVNAHSPVTSWFAANVDLESDQYLVSPPLTLPANAILSFWHYFDFEADGDGYYDGGVVEISTAGTGGPWTDLGSLITRNGYSGTIDNNYNNPLGTRQAFSAESDGIVETRVDLSAYSGTVHLRFRVGTDESISDGGWWVDDVSIYAATNWNPIASVPVHDTPYCWTVPPGLVSNYCVRARFSGPAYRASEWCAVGPFNLRPDTDRDGIPDAWESTNGLNPLVDDAQVDSDIDGVSNFEEFVMDTDPLNIDRHLRIENITALSPPMISFSSSVNRVYNLDAANEMSPAVWETIFTNMPGSNAVISLPDWSGDASLRRFYRVRVKLP